MRILLAGASGFIGRALASALTADGHEVVSVNRAGSHGAAATVDLTTHTLDLSGAGGDIDSFDVVYQLLGAPLVPFRWSPRRREALRSSRLTTTDILARVVATSTTHPTLVVGCAVGYYGSRGDERLDESSSSGTGFLADLSISWEQAAAPARAAGSRVVLARSGIVLGNGGGVLKLQTPLFRLGLGARLGTGRQWTSWIALDDEVRALRFVADHDTIEGPVNLVAPNPVTNAEFSAQLGAAVGKSVLFAVPTAALYLAAGKVTTKETLLASQRVAPRVLQGADFYFDHPTLDTALRSALAST